VQCTAVLVASVDGKCDEMMNLMDWLNDWSEAEIFAEPNPL
jgi:hypothetical protein